jgi:hypothetical protein
MSQRAGASRYRRCGSIPAKFINFNYTATLQSLYGVPDGQVWHIHGRAAHPAEPLVLGHAWRPLAVETFSAQLDPEQADTRALEGAAIIDRYFSQSFKPTEQIIVHNQARFRALRNVTEIRVLGHALSDVDLPYFKAIAANVTGRRNTSS